MAVGDPRDAHWAILLAVCAAGSADLRGQVGGESDRLALRRDLARVIRAEALARRPWGVFDDGSGAYYFVTLVSAAGKSRWERLDGWCLDCKEGALAGLFTPLPLAEVARLTADALAWQAADSDAWPFGTQVSRIEVSPSYQALVLALVCDCAGLPEQADCLWRDLAPYWTSPDRARKNMTLAADCRNRLIASLGGSTWSRSEAAAAIVEWHEFFGRDDPSERLDGLLAGLKASASCADEVGSSVESLVARLRFDTLPEVLGRPFLGWNGWRPLRSAPAHERLCELGVVAAPALLAALGDQSPSCSVAIDTRNREQLTLGDLAHRTLARMAGWPVAKRDDVASWREWYEKARLGSGPAWVAEKIAARTTAEPWELALFVRQGGDLDVATRLVDFSELGTRFLLREVLSQRDAGESSNFDSLLGDRLPAIYGVDCWGRAVRGFPVVAVRVAAWLGRQPGAIWAAGVIGRWTESRRRPTVIETVGLLWCEDPRVDALLLEMEREPEGRERVIAAFGAILENGQASPQLTEQRVDVLRRILVAEVRNEAPWRGYTTIRWKRRPVVMLDATLGDVAACSHAVLGGEEAPWSPLSPSAFRRVARTGAAWAADSWQVALARPTSAEAEPAPETQVLNGGARDRAGWQERLRTVRADTDGLLDLAKVAGELVVKRGGEVTISLARLGRAFCWCVDLAPTPLPHEISNVVSGPHRVDWLVDVVVDGRHMASGARAWCAMPEPVTFEKKDAARVMRALQSRSDVPFEIRIGVRAAAK